jgi:hypothetical protein
MNCCQKEKDYPNLCVYLIDKVEEIQHLSLIKATVAQILEIPLSQKKNYEEI